jgi:hypothetical protein
MKTLTTFALAAIMIASISGASASMGLRNEGVQNYMYYFGAPCATPCAVEPAPCALPCAPEPTCCPPEPVCMKCCPAIHGIFY